VSEPVVADSQTLEERFFQQMMDLFIGPEIRCRKSKGTVGEDFSLRAAQILFYVDGRAAEVRLNSEVEVEGEARLRLSCSFEPGEAIPVEDIEGITLSLPESVDPNCGHATFVRLGRSRWALAFDFRYNKALANQHLDLAEEFYATAALAREQGHTSACIDNLFSACELTVKAMLLGIRPAEIDRRTSHRAIGIGVNRFANAGMVSVDHSSAFNRLTGLRRNARYLDNDRKVDSQLIDELLSTVAEMVRDARARSTS